MEVVLVDERDGERGTMGKLQAHEEGELHRALSVLVFNSDGHMLLQKRADGKYHSPGKWSNACCTHPLPGEGVEEAAHRRLQEELGFDCELQEVGQVVYRADVGGGLTEHEFDHILLGQFDGEPDLDPQEVAEVRWAPLKDIERDVLENPEDYTPWFRMIFAQLIGGMERF